MTIRVFQYRISGAEEERQVLGGKGHQGDTSYEKVGNFTTV